MVLGCMKKYIFISSFFLFFVCVNSLAQNFSSVLKSDSVRKVVNSVAQWQMDSFHKMNEMRVYKESSDMSWANGVFLSDLASWAESEHNEKQIEWYESIGRKNNYTLNDVNHRIYHADDFAVCMMYIRLYERTGLEKVLEYTRARMDYVMHYPSKSSLEMKTENCFDRWSWADALYMVPPTFTAMYRLSVKKEYLDFMYKEYKAAYDYLFDKKESLFYRDSNYFIKSERNGQKVFWGRGNAWVLGGLCQILDYLPAKTSSRCFFEKLYKSMINKIVTLQDSEGYWHASMLDPESYPAPETSSTGLFTYSLWWGLNQGLLDDSYRKYAEKGWKAMVKAVHPNGMLGWVQPIGADPQKVTKDMTEVYGAGAMLLAGKEILLNLKKKIEVK